MKACYTQALAYFDIYPEEIQQAWKDPGGHPHGCLFRFCSPDGHTQVIEDHGRIGCPTMVANGDYIAYTPELTRKCRAMIRANYDELSPEDLAAIAAIQDEMDHTIRDPEWLRKNRAALYPRAGIGLYQAKEDEDDDADK